MLQRTAVNVLFHFINHLQQVLAILILKHGLCNLSHTIFRNPAIAINYCKQFVYCLPSSFINHPNISALPFKLIKIKILMSKKRKDAIKLCNTPFQN